MRPSRFRRLICLVAHHETRVVAADVNAIVPTSLRRCVSEAFGAQRKYTSACYAHCDERKRTTVFLATLRPPAAARTFGAKMLASVDCLVPLLHPSLPRARSVHTRAGGTRQFRLVDVGVAASTRETMSYSRILSAMDGSVSWGIDPIIRSGLEAVISQRICVQELELNLISYLLFCGSKLIGFERSLICT